MMHKPHAPNRPRHRVAALALALSALPLVLLPAVALATTDPGPKAAIEHAERQAAEAATAEPAEQGRRSTFLALSPDGETAAEYTSRDVSSRRMATRGPPGHPTAFAPACAPRHRHGSSGSPARSGDRMVAAGYLLAVQDGPDTSCSTSAASCAPGCAGPDGQRLAVLVAGRPRSWSTKRPAAASRSASRRDRADVLRAPADAVRPLGWAGSRVVWLTGAAGAQRLVLADESAEHTRDLDALRRRRRRVESVTWSTDLTGTVRR